MSTLRTLLRHLLAFCCIGYSLSSYATQPAIEVVTEHLPPYQFIGKDNQLTGISVEIVRAMMAKAQVDVPIQILPWPKAYDMALGQKNVMIFSINRSKARQSQFKWVGDFLKQHYYFISLKSRKDIRINNIQDVKNFKTGVSRNSFEHQMLSRYGFAAQHNLVISDDQLPLVEQLYQGKVDLLFGSKITLLGLIHYLEKDVSAIELTYQINESPGNVAIAFSKATDDAVVNRFRQAFKAIEASGELNLILTKWINAFNQNTYLR